MSGPCVNLHEARIEREISVWIAARERRRETTREAFRHLWLLRLHRRIRGVSGALSGVSALMVILALLWGERPWIVVPVCVYCAVVFARIAERAGELIWLMTLGAEE